MAPVEQQAKQAKAAQLAGKKAPNARVLRYLKTTEPKLVESGKQVLLLQGLKASAATMAILKELRAIQAPAAKLLSKKNPLTLFDDVAAQQSLEFLTTKNDCALFCLASHNKKRPHNLIFGRTFDRRVLDMAEVGVTYFKSMAEYGGSVPKKRIGSKPVLLFSGDVWQSAPLYRNLQNLWTDFYRGDVVDKLVASGIDHVVVFTVAEDFTSGQTPALVRIHQRTYHVALKKNHNETTASPSNTPVAVLTPSGPDLDMVVRRTQWADKELALAARQQPYSVKRASTKHKNQSTNLFGETIGRLHLDKQNVDQMGGRKAKALRRAEQTAKLEERAATEADLATEEQMDRAEFTSTFGFAQEAEQEAAPPRTSKRTKRS